MSSSVLRLGVGARLIHDGELFEVAELHAGRVGTEAVLRGRMYSCVWRCKSYCRAYERVLSRTDLA
ncbi:Uncharacterised protein [Mycobacteroides abscessus subsp. bolletii]|nr:Uncharacterised protein [Mycobacteroides abscessus subsp. bolletii]SLF65658.1 Uncharacterised protein [Mycobacteroides abscessus subsp. bolletii]